MLCFEFDEITIWFVFFFVLLSKLQMRTYYFGEYTYAHWLCLELFHSDSAIYLFSTVMKYVPTFTDSVEYVHIYKCYSAYAHTHEGPYIKHTANIHAYIDGWDVSVSGVYLSTAEVLFILFLFCLHLVSLTFWNKWVVEYTLNSDWKHIKM